MDDELYVQVETTRNALLQAHSRIESALRTLRKRRSRFGLDYDRTHNEIAQSSGGLAAPGGVGERKQGR